jgi:hypothetical protein
VADTPGALAVLPEAVVAVDPAVVAVEPFAVVADEDGFDELEHAPASTATTAAAKTALNRCFDN